MSATRIIDRTHLDLGALRPDVVVSINRGSVESREWAESTPNPHLVVTLVDDVLGRSGYVLTHVPTGRYVPGTDTTRIREARAVARRLAGLDWSSSDGAVLARNGCREILGVAGAP